LSAEPAAGETACTSHAYLFADALELYIFDFVKIPVVGKTKMGYIYLSGLITGETE
jgi:hypothetical protein